MRRLIDADELIEIIEGNENLIDWEKEECISCVATCDTAYDVDAVVELLENEKEKVGFVKATTEANAYIRGINDAIKIVKVGSVADN